PFHGRSDLDDAQTSAVGACPRNCSHSARGSRQAWRSSPVPSCGAVPGGGRRDRTVPRRRLRSERRRAAAIQEGLRVFRRRLPGGGRAGGSVGRERTVAGQATGGEDRRPDSGGGSDGGADARGRGEGRGWAGAPVCRSGGIETAAPLADGPLLK